MDSHDDPRAEQYTVRETVEARALPKRTKDDDAEKAKILPRLLMNTKRKERDERDGTLYMKGALHFPVLLSTRPGQKTVLERRTGVP